MTPKNPFEPSSRLLLAAYRGSVRDFAGILERGSRALATPDGFGHIGSMKRTSLAHAKAQLSALVSEAQHRGQRVIILRHGKPSAAIVPVDVALAASRSRRPGAKGLTPREVRRLFGLLGKGTAGRSAVADLLATRR